MQGNSRRMFIFTMLLMIHNLKFRTVEIFTRPFFNYVRRIKTDSCRNCKMNDSGGDVQQNDETGGIEFMKESEDVQTCELENSIPLESGNVIREGKAEILVPPGTSVFYNPVQEFNRDLSTAVIELFSRQHREKKWSKNGGTDPPGGIRILEALSATGLRSIRYAKEISGVKEIVANDISATAVGNIAKNIEHNNVQDIVKTSHKDACEVMFENRHPRSRFEAVDIDPYGCPSQFLDSAVQCVADGGLLLVTCTDMAVLCGNAANTCYVKYGAMSLRIRSCHEMALRIVLQCIESHANRYKRYITPLLSVSADFYVRVFVKINTSASTCNKTVNKLSMVYQCNGCETHSFQPLGLWNEAGNRKTFSMPQSPIVGKICEHCGAKHQMGGPIWSAPIHDVHFVEQLLELVSEMNAGTQKRLMGVLTMVREELSDVPLYYTIDRLCSVVKANSLPMMVFRSAILNGGYRVSYSHANRTSIKTNAPASFLWDVLRTWTTQNEGAKSLETMAPGSPARVILSKTPEATVDLALRPDANPPSRELKLTRFQENPTSYWGPGSRSSTNLEKPTKKAKNQGRKRKWNKKDSPVTDDNTKTMKPDEILT